MSALTCAPTANRLSILSTLLQHLHRKSPSRSHIADELKPLSNRLLVDIGVDPRDFPYPAQRELDRIELLYRGWRPMVPPSRR